MTKPKILVIDDEGPARKRMLRFLGEDERTFAVFEARNAAEGLAAIKTEKPDLVFLDIEMPGMSGIEMLAHLEVRSFKLIFATAFDEFAVRAFEENACDYLLKPFDQERFFKALDRALGTTGREGGVKSAEHALLERSQYLSHLLIQRNGMSFRIATKDMQCLLAKDNYTQIFADSEEFLSELSLNHLESRLSPDLFLRVHRAAIVNLDAIVRAKFSDDASVVLRSGQEVTVSRRCKQILKKAMAK